MASWLSTSDMVIDRLGITQLSKTVHYYIGELERSTFAEFEQSIQNGQLVEFLNNSKLKSVGLCG